EEAQAQAALARQISEAAVTERKTDEPAETRVEPAAAHLAIVAPRPVAVGTLRTQNDIALLQLVGANLNEPCPAQHHEGMPAAGLNLDALARPHQELILRRHIELPDVRHLSQSRLAGCRIHRCGANVEIAYVIGPALTTTHAGAAVRRRA